MINNFTIENQNFCDFNNFLNFHSIFNSEENNNIIDYNERSNKFNKVYKNENNLLNSSLRATEEPEPFISLKVEEDFFREEKQFNTNTNEKVSFSTYCSFNKIKEILQTIPKSNDISKKFKDNEFIKVEQEVLNKEKRKRKSGYNVVKEDENHIRKKRGRARQANSRTIVPHNLLSSNNVINKVKGKLFDYLVNFINNLLTNKEEIINNKKKRQNIIRKINYKYIKDLKKSRNLKYLNMKLKDLLSLKISPKTRKNQNFNQELIEKIINQEKFVHYYYTIRFVFNITFKEWLDLFRYKTKIVYLKNSYNNSF